MEEEIFNINNDRIVEAIKCYFACNIPVYLHGLSGTGKSARAKQLDPDLTIIYLSNATIELINGKSVSVPAVTKKMIMPNGDVVEVVVKESMMMDIKPTWLTILEEKCQREPEKIHILFFDELSNAMPTIQNYAFNIILNKEVNGKWKLPENTRIIAAGNEMEESIVANEIAEPLYLRFAHLNIEINLQDWLLWAIKANIHPTIISFVALKGLEALKSKYTGTSPSTNPRGWEFCSNLIYTTNSISAIDTLLDEKTCAEFMRFIYNEIVPLESVIENNLYEDLKEYLPRMTIEAKYLMVANYSKVDALHFDQIYEVIKAIHDKKLEYLFLTMAKRNHLIALDVHKDK